VKLYVFPITPNPTRIRLYLAEKRETGAEFDLEEVTVNLREQEQKSTEHLKRNPLAKLPVLEIEEGVDLGLEYGNIACWDAAFRERISAKQVLLP
jgi:glutathione S-transferase